MKVLITAAALSLLGTGFAPVTHAEDGEALTKKFGCVACHSVDKKMVGPAFKEVATKYASDKAASQKLADKIIAGGAGNWGAIPMPPHKGRVSDAQAKTMADYVLSRK